MFYKVGLSTVGKSPQDFRAVLSVNDAATLVQNLVKRQIKETATTCPSECGDCQACDTVGAMYRGLTDSARRLFRTELRTFGQATIRFGSLEGWAVKA